MIKLSSRMVHWVFLFLALLSLMSVSVLPDYFGSRRAFAQAAALPALEPGWSLTGNLKTARSGHTATLLPNGKVLVVGGRPCGGANSLNSTELYDPLTKTWSYSGALGIGRADHTATLLSNGRVLVAGGAYASRNVDFGEYEPLITQTAELYDPSTGTWSFTGSSSLLHLDHTAMLLPNGKVLLAGGGLDWGGTEIYNPESGRWDELRGHDIVGNPAVLLRDGKVLLLGGIPDTDNFAVRLYDPATGIWRATGSPKTIHAGEVATVTLLPNGKVLAMGHGDFIYSMYAEMYDPASETWSSIRAPDYFPVGKAIVLTSGKVLVASPSFAELYDPAAGLWSSTSVLYNRDYIGTATLLSNGDVLFTMNTACNPGRNSSAIYDPGAAPSGPVSSVSAASYSLMGLASEAIATAFGAALATTTASASAIPPPTQLGGTSVKIKDSAGDERLAPLFFVSPNQVNYQIPTGTAQGIATVAITNGNGLISSGVAVIRPVGPGLFTANASGEGVAAALALRVKPDGSQTYEPIAQFDVAQNRFIARPIDLGPEGEQVYLLLFGTGFRQRSSLAAVYADLGEGSAKVTFAGAQGDFPGLDQLNVLVPRSLLGRGEVRVVLNVDNSWSNPVQISIR